MVYMETIEESKTWVCPKSGVWKVICIGGGGAGLCNTIVGGSGGTTSFGSILSANGGAAASENVSTNAYSSNGYNGAVEYGSSNNMFRTGLGYGASGIGYPNVAGSTKIYSGRPGELKSVIIDISEGTSIPCTIGSGGEEANGLVSGAKYYACAGADGAIIVQYLGESM